MTKRTTQGKRGTITQGFRRERMAQHVRMELSARTFAQAIGKTT
jgi:hypothetical protein